MNICLCGAQAGYPHREDCPYPLFHCDAFKARKWREARDKGKRQREALAAMLEQAEWDETESWGW